MDGILAVALRGTGHVDGATMAIPPPLDALAAGLSDAPVERKLLLLAGAWAVYREAGYALPDPPAEPEPAPEEVWPECSPAAVRLIETLLAGQQEAVLLEALDLLRQRGRRLPPALLPQALSVQTPEARAAVASVVGRRGAWLGRLNPAWNWLAESLLDVTAAPANGRTIWEEGTPGQRLAVIRRLRAEQPAEARQWIADVWQKEKADYRAELVQALVARLSADDEAFLQLALDDRSANVRAQAAALLARLPGSAFSVRMEERCDAMLEGGRRRGSSRMSGASPESGDGGASPTWRIVATPPQAFDEQWARDGITVKPPPGTGERAWWLTQLLAFVPLAHWEDRFAAGPPALIAAIDGQDWTAAILHGWTRAAMAQECQGWAAALWDRLSQEEPANEFSTAATLARSLVPVMRQADAERRVAGVLEAIGDGTGVRWVHTLQALPPPWSAPFGATYLALLRRHLESLAVLGKYVATPWLMTMPTAAVALPPACFPAALQPWTDPEVDSAPSDRYRAQLRTFTETVDIRRQLREEIR